MTIRTRLTWLFLILAAVILLAALSSTFILHAHYTHAEFNARLRDRAEVTGYVFLEEDELRASSLLSFRRRFLQTLPNEILQIYDSKRRPRFIGADDRIQLPEAIIDRIVVRREAYFSLGDRQAVGIFYRDNQGEYVIVAAAENRSGHQRLRHLALVLAMIFVGSLVVIYLAGRLFAGRALRPISAMNDEVDQITASDLHRRLGEGSGTDELARLAQTFNRLLGRLEDSFTAQRAFVSNASHELRTPLTATIGELQVLLNRARTVAEYQTALGSVLDELLGLKNLSNDLLELAQATAGALPRDAEPVRLDEALEDAIGLVRVARPKARFQLDLNDLPADSEALERPGNRRLLTQALTNLLDNAAKYSDDQPVTVRLAAGSPGLVLSIRDRGIGISAEDQKRVFEPFYRAANARAHPGHGIGLALAAGILNQHRGWVALTSEPGQGTQVTVMFV